ncbi:MAG: hypothetical protein IPM97_01475 [Bdellovibrionaceae bacterium]|nr:hypothetical protein [Pseudobdellovibrionaceae bacterium]
MNKLLLTSLVLIIVSCQASPKISNPYSNSTISERVLFKKVSLPLKPGTAFKISQGAFGCCTHNISGYEYAWDFDVPYGNQVIQGQIIAETANNGFHCTPQLHFNIFQDRKHTPEVGAPKTIPVLFYGLPDEGIAKEGFEGVVDNSGSSTKITFDLDLIRPWNKEDKKQFPTPLIAVFKKDKKVLVFVGDHHSDQIQTYQHFEMAFEKLDPQIVVIENVAYRDGENPSDWAKKYLKKSKEELYKEGGIAPNAARLAHANNVPFIGGEPSIEEQMNSPFLLSKNFSKDDIQNVQVLQRIPYRRDKMNISEEQFFKYAMKYYRIKGQRANFKTEFSRWYKDRTQRDFSYSTFAKEETDVNCLPNDTYLQKVACAFNVSRDRVLVENIGLLLQKYDRVLVTYGTGHFVQEYPAFLKAFGHSPEYVSPKVVDSKGTIISTHL